MELLRGQRGQTECCGSAECQRGPLSAVGVPTLPPQSQEGVCRVVTMPELVGWVCGRCSQNQVMLRSW